MEGKRSHPVKNISNNSTRISKGRLRRIQKCSIEKEYYFQQTVLRKLDIHMQKNEFGSYLTPHPYIKSTCVTELKVMAKNIRLLEENIVENIHYCELGNSFLIGHQQDINKRKTRNIGLH